MSLRFVAVQQGEPSVTGQLAKVGQRGGPLEIAKLGSIAVLWAATAKFGHFAYRNPFSAVRACWCFIADISKFWASSNLTAHTVLPHFRFQASRLLRSTNPIRETSIFSPDLATRPAVP